jgi:hypothetical protein
MLLVHALIGKLGLIGVSMRPYTARTGAYYRLFQNFFITPLPQIMRVRPETGRPFESFSASRTC